VISAECSSTYLLLLTEPCTRRHVIKSSRNSCPSIANSCMEFDRLRLGLCRGYGYPSGTICGPHPIHLVPILLLNGRFRVFCSDPYCDGVSARNSGTRDVGDVYPDRLCNNIRANRFPCCSFHHVDRWHYNNRRVNYVCRAEQSEEYWFTK